MFVTLQNGKENVKVKTTSLVHNFSILANWSKVNVKWFNELWCPQSDPHPLYNVG